VFLLEPRKPALTFVFSLFLQSYLVEEVFIGVLQALNGELERLTTCFLQPSEFSLDDWQFFLVVLAFERGLILFVGLDPFTEEIVEDPATTPEVFAEQHFLFSIWFQSELIGVEVFHLSPWDLMYSTINSRMTSLMLL